MEEIEIQQNSYFAYRKVTSNFYKDIKLPEWFRQEIKDKDARISDYGGLWTSDERSKKRVL